MTIDTWQNGLTEPDNYCKDRTYEAKAGLAQMLKGGVIMDVVNAEQVITLSSA